jgi:hypothetical protein
MAKLVWSLVPTALLLSSPAAAHFRMEQPADALQGGGTGTGSPPGGDQKTEPCGAGTPSGLVTQARAGSKLHVKVVETVGHGGHYRVAFAANRAELTSPAVTGTCGSAAIMTTPTLPVLADGLFPHTQAQAAAGTMYETDVTLPNVPPGNYTLQVLEFMTPHAAPCFYYHCAAVQIVDADAGVPDGGVVVGDAGGSAPDAGATPGGSGGDAGGPSAQGTPSAATDEGCNAGSAGRASTSASLALPMVAALGAVGALRRRRRRGHASH